MGYFQVRYDSRVVIYDHRAFIRLATFLQLKPVAGRLKLLCSHTNAIKPGEKLINNIFLNKMGHSRPLFSLFSSFQYS